MTLPLSPSVPVPSRPPLWDQPLTEVLNAAGPAWVRAYETARRAGQGGQGPSLDAQPDVWLPLKDAWSHRPDVGRRWAWEVGRHAWTPALKAVVLAGLITVPELEKPRPDRFPLRLAESVADKHPSVFRWLVEQGEPAEALWGDGTRCLRDVVHAQPHKKVAQLWLKRPEEHAPEHLRRWLVAQWAHQHGDDLRALVWNAWNGAMDRLTPTAREVQELQAAQAWSKRLLEDRGWVVGVTAHSDPMAQACWARWKNRLDEDVIFAWAHVLNERLDQPPGPGHPEPSPRFVEWFNIEVREAHRRYEQKQLREAVQAHGRSDSIVSPRVRSRL